MPSTEIVLTENVPGHEVTPASMRQLESLKKKRAEREANELNDAEELSRRIGKLRIVFTLETGETGKAFGSITAQDIVTRIKNEIGMEIDRHKVVLDHPIKTIGEHEIAIKLHHDVSTQFSFQVKSADAPKVEAAVESDEPERKHRSFFKRRKES
jgi:large subunit ribosomal protein L9